MCLDILKVLKITSLQFLGNDKALTDTHYLAGSGQVVQAICKASKITNLQNLKNGILDSHDFLHEDRPQDFEISTFKKAWSGMSRQVHV